MSLICKLCGHNYKWVLKENFTGAMICKRCGDSLFKDNIDVVLIKHLKEDICESLRRTKTHKHWLKKTNKGKNFSAPGKIVNV